VATDGGDHGRCVQGRVEVVFEYWGERRWGLGCPSGGPGLSGSEGVGEWAEIYSQGRGPGVELDPGFVAVDVAESVLMRHEETGAVGGVVNSHWVNWAQLHVAETVTRACGLVRIDFYHSKV